MPDAGRAPRLAERGLLLLLLALMLWTFRDYGVTWDESLQWQYGERVLAYFRSGFRDTSYAQLLDLRYYGPAFEALAALAYELLGTAKAETRHLLIALSGLLTVAGAMGFARRLERPSLPLLAALALVTWPRFYGHSFNNSKDIPFACAFAWAMLALALFAEKGKAASWVDGFRAGLAIGLALALRAGGFLLFALLPLAWLLAGVFRPGAGEGSGRPSLARALAIFPVAWGVMVAGWPFAHEDPVAKPLAALQTMERFPAIVFVLFEGRFIRSDQLPWYYVPKYFLITTPPLHLALLALGIGFAARSVLGRASEGMRARLAASLLLSWFFVPLAYVLARRPPLYDEIRHLLFLVPAGALLVGVGLVSAMERLRPALGRLAWLLPAALLLPVPAMWRLHPYETTYFSACVGGVAGAAPRYDTDYWLSSYKEAMEWLNRQPWKERRKRRVLLAANPDSRYCADYYAAPHIETGISSELGVKPPLPQEFDDYIGTSRYQFELAFPGTPVVHTVGRDGAIFAVVRSRHPPGGP